MTWLLTGLLLCLSLQAAQAQDSREASVAPLLPAYTVWELATTTPDGYTVWRTDINSGCSFSDHDYLLDISAEPADMSDVTYSMTNYDVDYNSPGCSGGPEVDLMYFNGNSLGFLTGANDSWSLNSWPVTNTQVVKGLNAIHIDTDAPGTGCWCVGVGYIEVRAKVGFKVKSHTPQSDDKNRDFHSDKVDLTVTFSAEYDTATLTQDTFKLEYRDAGGAWQAVAGSFTQLAPEKFRFVPGAHLKDGVRYRATVKSGASGVKGKNGGELTADEVWYFHTAPDLSVTDNFDYGSGSVCPPTVAPCPGVELAVFQVARNQNMVPGGKEAVVRVYLRWKLHTDVHVDDQLREDEFEVALSGAATLTQRQTMKRPDRYTAPERVAASHTVNLRHTPGSSFNYSVEVTPQPQTNATPVKYTQSRNLGSTGRSPSIGFNYYFLQEGAWSGGVPAAEQASGVALMTGGTQLITDQFPVLATTFNNRGAFSIGYTYTGTTLADPFCGSVQEVACPYWFSSTNMAEYLCVYDKLTGMRGGIFGIGADKFAAAMVPAGVCNGVTGFAMGGNVFMHVAGSGANDGTIAHEVGHIYSISPANNPTASHRNDSVNVEGYQVRTSTNRSYVENQPNAVSLMHTTVQPSGTQWIHNDDYVALTGTVSLAANRDAWTAFATVSGPFLLVSGRIDTATGQVQFAPAISQESPSHPPASTGTCTVALVDGAGAVLADGMVTPGVIIEAQYQDGSEMHGHSSLASGPQPFSISLPWFDSAQQVRVSCGGVPLATLPRSPNAPVVDFVGLTDGATLSGTRLLTWTGSDADGPNLAFQLHVSLDGGTSWTPVMPLSLNRGFNLDTTLLPSGPKQLRVLVTDGFNTAQVVRSVGITNPLKVQGTLPAGGAVGVGTGSPISVTFVSPLNESSLTSSTFRVTEPNGTIVNGQLRYSAATRTATFTPAAPLRHGTTYTTRLSSPLRDSLGNALSPAYTWSFTTAADGAPPFVVSTSPLQGQFGVPLDALVQVRLNEAVRLPAVGAALELLDSTGAAVGGTLTQSSDQRSVIFVPAVSLAPGAEYTARLSAAVTDVAGNPLGSSHSWRFTTGSTAEARGFRIIGNYTDQPFDPNGDGFYDRLAVSLDVEVLTAGTYNLNARLVDRDDTLLEWQTTGNVSLARGVHTLTLNFNSIPIRSNGVDGPYTLEAVSFYRTSTPWVSDVRYRAYQTYPYRASAFYSVLALAKLPDQLVEWNTTRENAFNLRDYTTHASLPVSSVVYSILINTDPRVGVSLRPGGEVDILPAAGVEAESDVVIRARDTLGNTVTSTFRVSVQRPRPSKVTAPEELTMFTQQSQPIDVSVRDQWDRLLTSDVTVTFEATEGTVSPASVVTTTGTASTAYTSTSTPGTAFVTTRAGGVSALTRVIVSAPPAPNRLYPIAVHADTVRAAQVGDTLPNILQGPGQGNFGWLSWTGDTSEAALVRSLTPPGDSKTWVNPEDPSDDEISVGDMIRGKPGVTNSGGVRAALEVLMQERITVPVWDLAGGSGDGALYRVSGFACVQVTGYRLPGQGWISAVYHGSGPCR